MAWWDRFWWAGCRKSRISPIFNLPSSPLPRPVRPPPTSASMPALCRMPSTSRHWPGRRSSSPPRAAITPRMSIRAWRPPAGRVTGLTPPPPCAWSRTPSSSWIRSTVTSSSRRWTMASRPSLAATAPSAWCCWPWAACSRPIWWSGWAWPPIRPPPVAVPATCASWWPRWGSCATRWR